MCHLLRKFTFMMTASEPNVLWVVLILLSHVFIFSVHVSHLCRSFLSAHERLGWQGASCLKSLPQLNKTFRASSSRLSSML